MTSQLCERFKCKFKDLTGDESTLVKEMAWRRQATRRITRVNVDPDLCRHMASLGRNDLNVYVLI